MYVHTVDFTLPSLISVNNLINSVIMEMTAFPEKDCKLLIQRFCRCRIRTSLSDDLQKYTEIYIFSICEANDAHTLHKPPINE